MSKAWPIFVFAAACFFGYKQFAGGGGVNFPMKRISQSAPAEAVPDHRKIRVILFTGTEWCPACVNLDQAVIKTEDWQEFAKKEIRFNSFDFPVDRSRISPEIAQMAENYNITGFPTMLVLDQNNQEISRQVGSVPSVHNYRLWIRSHSRFYEADGSGDPHELADTAAE